MRLGPVVPKPNVFLRQVREAVEAGDHAGAIAALDLLFRLHPDAIRPEWRLRRARSLLELGRSLEADAEMTRAMESPDATPAIAMAWAVSVLRRGDRDEALRRFEIAIERFPDAPDPRWLHHLSVLYFDRERPDLAELQLRRLVDMEPAMQDESWDLTEDGTGEIESLRLPLSVCAMLQARPLAEELARRTRAVLRAHGWAIAAQHLRNLIVSCWGGFAPPDVRELIALAPQGRAPFVLKACVAPIERALVRHLGALRPQLQPIDREARRCLFVASYMPRHALGPHKRFYCSYAAALAMRPETEAVLVLITQEFGPEGPVRQDGELDAERIEEWRAEARLLAPDHAHKIAFWTPEREGPVHPYEASLSQALAFRPSLVLAVLGIYGSTVLPQSLQGLAPIVAAQVSLRNPEPPHADLVLSHGHRASFEDLPTPDKWRNGAIPMQAFAAFSEIDPATLGPPAALRVASAVSGGRLELGLLANGGALLDNVLAFLREQPDAAWLMLGVRHIERLREAIDARAEDGLRERIHIIPWADDLGAVLRQCTIYFHPPGISGGAMASIMAPEAGRPTIAPRDNDAANYLPVETLYEDDREAFALLARLAADPSLRDALAARQRAHLRSNNSIEAASAGLDRNLRAAIERFERRGTPA